MIKILAIIKQEPEHSIYYKNKYTPDDESVPYQTKA